MAIRSSVLAWKISRTKEPDWLQSIGLQRGDMTEVTQHTRTRTKCFQETAKEPLNPNLAHKYPVLHNESEHNGIFKTLEFCISYRFLMLILELAKCSTHFSLTGHHPPLFFQE